MRIFHPRPQIGRQKFIGVDFHGGIAEVDELHPERRLALEQHGFAIQDDDGSVSIPGDWPLPLPEALPTTAPEPKPNKSRKPKAVEVDVESIESDVLPAKPDDEWFLPAEQTEGL